MTTKTVDKERLQASLWKVEKLLENISDIDKLLFALSEIKITTTFKIGPKAKEAKYSTVEDVVTRRERLQNEKRVKEFGLQLARFDLSSELDRLHNHLWPGTIQMIRDYYTEGLDPYIMRKKYGRSYIEKIRRTTG